MAHIEAVDLFCGAGGLTAGLQAAGVRVTAGIDVDPACRYPFEANHPGARFVERDVSQVTGGELQACWSPGVVRLLAGCAPCQPFSSYARGRPADHTKWGMLYQFSRLVRESQPDLVTMENVLGLEAQEPFADFVHTLRECGFEVCHAVLNAADYGVPQRRRRLVLLASRLGPVSLPQPTHPGRGHWVSVKDAIGELPVLAHGQSCPEDPLHRAAMLSPLNLARIQASKPGGTWRDWPTYLVADCHVRESGRRSTGVYGRMSWDDPSPTMTTLCTGYGNGRFGHPAQDRGITLREAAIFQSFPRDYRFVPPGVDVPNKTVSRLIGNAVPPKLAEAVGRQLLEAASHSRAGQ
ncbi:DNA cytosine methyltransferase [Malikia sp.]|uniref:DNA cytosine methyltransferase n=1 Tax=Malikia sp. TaxID=2070706 RepID=UPI002631BC6B|nr:DNA cytosine methyltransferase [Malikia sp.]MDD2728198.1 DNA cytosine methyltransferase [Malikia sp.]